MIFCNFYRPETRSYLNGANLHYSEVSRVLKKRGLARFHSFPRIPDMRTLGKSDIVLSNAGPYAYAYFHLREKHGLKFRIVKDVQTSFWSGYLLQETLCNPYLREGDLTLFPSEFTRQLYIKLFPGVLAYDNTFVCYPAASFFPKAKKREHRSNALTIGWIGRVCREKNFLHALKCFVRAAVSAPDLKAEMLVVGEAAREYRPGKVKKILKPYGLSERYSHANNGRVVSHSEVWNYLNKMDILLFPSVSSAESLGRVLIEAAHAGIPVIAAEHAAAPEIVPKGNLVPVDYYRGRRSILDPCSLGEPDADKLAGLLLHPERIKTGTIGSYSGHGGKLARIMKGEQGKEKKLSLAGSAGKLIQKASVSIEKGYRLKGMEALKAATASLKKAHWRDLGAAGYEVCNELGFFPSVRIE